MLTQLPHILLEGPSARHAYASPKSVVLQARRPARDRAQHAEYIARRLEEAWNQPETNAVVDHVRKNGIYLEFRGQEGHDLVTKSLEVMGKANIRLCNIRVEPEAITDKYGKIAEQQVTYATVFVPNDQRSYFSKKVEDYATRENTKTINRDKIFPQFEAYSDRLEELFVDINDENKLSLKPEITNSQIESLIYDDVPVELVQTLKKTPKNAKLVECIEDIRRAVARSFWVDKPDLFPNEQRQWCEVWLRDEKEDEDIEQKFVTLLQTLKLPVKEGRLKFPERVVKLINVNGSELEVLQNSCDWVAEFRKAKETAHFFLTQTNREQADWVQSLRNRMAVDTESLVSICILDTGVNNGHPLLSEVLQDEDKHAVKGEWGTHDHEGHGTLMAGLATFGDLQRLLESGEEVYVSHKIESSKILPQFGEENPKELWGYMTAQGISLAEIQAPDRKRIFCMAVATKDGRDQGKPSSWSGAVDQLSAGVQDHDKRLILLCAGNYTCNLQDLKEYPSIQISDSIHDPGQAWNAVTVGAYTDLTELIQPSLNGYQPIAGSGQLSPYTTTSFDWEKEWPIKPEVVFEGGNIAKDNSGFVTECDELSLLSTNFQPFVAHFGAFRMTSAATAQAAHFAAKIQVQYPDYWPETIRALMVHSAEWTEAMKVQFAENGPKQKISKLLKACGYGVPNLDKALYCSSNSLTLVSQATLQPYRQERNEEPKTNEMHFYELPWPRSVLEGMGEIIVRLRITLSYFIEPGPGEIGWKDRYRYPSHILTFDINSPSELQEEFLRRINKAVRDEENGRPDTNSASSYWKIGSQNRNKGSIHSDIWEGTAAELAASNLIAVYPRIGWWCKRKYLNKANSVGRYALIVSIETSEQNVDIYTPVSIQVQTPIATDISL